MSHPAIVAYENDDETFDLHYSRNGAERYQLKQILDGYLEGEYDRLGEDMPPLLPSEVAEFATEKIQIEEHELIETEPIAESVEAGGVPRRIPDITAEILYVVRDWQVDAYSIVPVTPSLASLLAEHVVLNIYDCQELGTSPQQLTTSNEEPTQSISNVDFFDPSVYEEMSDPEYFGFSQYHLDLLNGIIDCAHKQRNDEPEPPNRMILQEDWVMQYKVRNPAHIPWSVVFVEVWSGDDENPTYPWAYDQRNLNPRLLANELRVELSVASVQELRNAVERARVDARTGYIDHKRWEGETRELARFLTLLQDRYGKDYSQEFSDDELVGEILVDSLSGETFQLGDSVIRAGFESL